MKKVNKKESSRIARKKRIRKKIKGTSICPRLCVKKSLKNIYVQLIDDVQEKVAVGIISAKFHNCLAEAMLETAKRARKTECIDIVALSGGVFCNRYLLDRLAKLLKKNSFRVLFNQRFPSNDGGLSLGQAAIAVNLLNRRK